ncbi:hypothetical protein A2631_02475 [Candidatus Daviesbacteria bacterium RIFCSPHIGHO2_01_FULL_44_29]|uniref:Activator of Hsp90 ATPase homologue 1/2-like C-terminal domain-containing protein n=1 Tax=Candidatus Daviesbacteria bacterium RIFCSPHIGHO2_02_FULL_43_12 TaxID=1797776 RepID=A0A1F5KK06_9BACT|nr:MAG: hypothetical protein A2631_02475 [Candidatus Daviesbacteria bacterium RIFCSPHIGHO2_01_FULL_44_29]OGE40193.1 MAG: hypothetical protein A3E86_04430 [Candidatus Daviesbacteria bacterium RIFCSPHIGHO2_12_FULL_47_45]OGE41253.1 MAG: hypothetical protein A3D25_01870 [Candidatus Daviesbacteria bacterium RIFCSPHIGHO2_02_FULL_43_12]OGE69454.1 MAG: hypothetical protein A3B55_03610 [Candidatus Daviesbacteria bacterium RIFCSPLOWO2_01_FULL_43_15]
MAKLFVDKTIQINAPVGRVWEALTRREDTDIWAPEFSSGSPQFHIESNWQLGKPVLWKDQNGIIIVEGEVTALEPDKFLRFTVLDVRGAKPPVTEEDGITYELSEQNGVTTLHVLQGDFSAVHEGEKYCQMSGATWDRVLPKVKEIAEK